MQKYKSFRIWVYRIPSSWTLFLLRFLLLSCCRIRFNLCTHLLLNLVQKYITEHRILKFEKITFLHNFEMCQNRSRNSIFCCFFIILLVPPMFKHFSIKLPRWNFACSFLNTQTSGGFSIEKFRKNVCCGKM